MAKIKLTKTAVEAAQPQAQDIELRDTVVPGFLCKITPAGRRVFMLQYRTNAGERRKPALGLFGELTVEQARVMAQDWLAEVRRGGDPGGAKTEARKAPTIAELCKKFMEDYSKKRNKPSTQEGYQGVIDRCIIPLLGRKKVLDVKRPDIAGLMEKLSYKPTEANKAFGVLRKMFTDIAHSGVPTKGGMKLTGHKTVAMFMHYIHTEDKPVRDAAELAASRRQAITGAGQRQSQETTA